MLLLLTLVVLLLMLILAEATDVCLNEKAKLFFVVFLDFSSSSFPEKREVKAQLSVRVSSHQQVSRNGVHYKGGVSVSFL